MVEKIADSSTLKWILGAVFTVAMTLLGLVSTGNTRDLDRLEQRVERTAVAVNDQAVQLSAVQTESRVTLKQLQADVSEIKQLIKEQQRKDEETKSRWLPWRKSSQ